MVRKTGPWLLLAVWAVAVAFKLPRMVELEASISSVFPSVWNSSRVFAWLVVTCEAAAVVLLLAPRTQSYGLRLTVLLSCIFLGYNVLRWLLHTAVPCTCFGALFKMPAELSVLCNIVMIAVATLSQAGAIAEVTHESHA
jgi:hypothetical protein